MMKKARHFLNQDPPGRNEICYPSFAGSLDINGKNAKILDNTNTFTISILLKGDSIETFH